MADPASLSARAAAEEIAAGRLSSQALTGAYLDRIAAREYDLVLSDLRMPVLDGPGLYRALFQGHSEVISRLAFITGDSLSTEIQSFLRDAKRPCLEKPFLPEDVLRLVAQVTELSRQPDRAD